MWNSFIKKEQQEPYFQKINERLDNDYSLYTVYPKKSDIYRAFQLTPYNKVKVVILGQDPYHNPGQAHGLSFSVNDGVKFPPSLRNLFKEYNSDLGYETPQSGNLKKWAENGVLLLNASLTVVENQPMSHSKIGWEIFTDNVIKYLNCREEPIVFILMGNFAIGKEKYITNPNHHIIKCAHPSPLSASRGFFGSKIFSRTNQLLVNKVDWQL